ncbi:MAG: hypothetical protein GY797_00590, partial [Deltaproteobacteria bacterium]|nr:hypothetical protein [Deltaproteobacteria bacterium]
MITKIQQGRTSPVHVIILAVCIFLPSTVHAFGVVPSLFLLCMLISHFYYHRPDFAKISSANKIIFGITVILSAIIVGTNVLVFAYAAVMKLSSHNISDGFLLKSQTTIHVFASTLFNFGYFFPIIIVFLILFMVLKKDYTNTTLHRYIFSLTVSLIPTLFIMVKNPQSIRPDFIYGILPYLLLFIALSIGYIAQELCKAQYTNIFSVIMTLFLIASTLPAFVSNVFIDNDRLDYREAARFISNINDANVYSTAPGYFNLYLDKRLVQQLADIDPATCQSPKDEYFLIRMRKGKSTHFFYDPKKLKNVQL